MRDDPANRMRAKSGEAIGKAPLSWPLRVLCFLLNPVTCIGFVVMVLFARMAFENRGYKRKYREAWTWAIYGACFFGLVFVLQFVPLTGLLSSGCRRANPLLQAKELGLVECDFDIHWPPEDPEGDLPPATSPLLQGTLAIENLSRLGTITGRGEGSRIGSQAEPPRGGVIPLRLSVTIRRPATEADREHWNSALAYPGIRWMREVRVWDAEEKWLWPNIAYLLRLPGEDRVERYGGMDPGKHVDNDFAAVLIRKYDAGGAEESAETKDSPLVSAEWHPVGVETSDLKAIIHTARSDEFRLHIGGESGSARGQFKVWLIYADFLNARPPRTWPKEREFAGGILAYFEIDWETLPGGVCRGVVHQKRPPQGTGFPWEDWVVRNPGSDRSEAAVRLSDIADQD